MNSIDRLSTGRKRPVVWVVDDDAANIELIKGYLEDLSVDIEGFTDGPSVMAATARVVPDLVLLDVRMPGMSGFDVSRSLKSDARTALVPIVFTTGMNAVQDRVKALEAGADDLLSKPIERVELLARVRSMLKMRQVHRALEAERAERLILRLSRSFPHRRALEMVSRGEDLAQDVGTELHVTVLFADLRGFTSWSEDRSPRLVVSVLNEFFSQMSGIILEHGGTLISFIGDAIFAAFGLPDAMDGDADRAVAAAQHMTERLSQLNAAGGFANVGDLEMNIAVHSGEVMAGLIGAPERLDYTIIGDTVNAADRLLEVAKSMGHQLVVSETTEAEMSGSIRMWPGPAVQLRGRKQPIRVFSLRSVEAPGALIPVSP